MRQTYTGTLDVYKQYIYFTQNSLRTEDQGGIHCEMAQHSILDTTKVIVADDEM